ncbi:MAG TPA: hypothetical protein P5079_11900, partial [Elusimicrobiota bacterium]|nr:hypothetical protein [Elusimicrobiota bacterium]
PFYTRSLRDKRWTLRVEPGQNSREGLFAKSIFGYKLTDNTYTRLYWDHFEKTGNGVGAEYNYYLPDVKGSVYSYRIEDRVAQTERWNFRAGHWQQLKPRWALQANAVFQSDQDFNNLYFRDDYERVRQRADSDAALTYQNPLYSARVSFEQDMTFNTTHQAFVRDHTVLPQLNLQSSPLNLGKREVYLTLTGNFINTYQRPEVTDLLTQKPTFYHERDLFKQSADGTLDLSKKIQLGKNTTLKPAVGVIEEWQAWRESGVSEIDRKDLYQGRVYTKTNLRRRLTRDLDGDLTHTYRVRWSPNQMKRDHSSSLLDSGTEANSLDLFLSYRMGRLLWVRASSGYDLRVLQGETIETVRQKISPPNVEVNITPTQTLSFFYRQSVLLYPARKTQTSQFSVQVGEIEKPHLESGLSYNVGTPHQLQVRHGAAFPLTKGWWVNGGVQYNAIGTYRMDYDSVKFIEKYLILKRDLHCWKAKAEIRQRPGVEEVFFTIDLKTNFAARQDMASPEEEQFYPAREHESP